MEKYYLKPQLDTRKSFNNLAVIEKEKDTIKLYSYNSLVLTIKGKEWKLNKSIKKDLLLSNTTIRHIKECLFQFLGIEDITKKELERTL